MRRKFSVELNGFLKKGPQAHHCVLLVRLCAEQCAGKIWWDFLGELWFSQTDLRGTKERNGGIWRTRAGLYWLDHPCTVAFIYLFSQFVMSLSSYGHSIECQ